MSKPMPNKPQTRMRLTVFGAKPTYASTNGATIKAIAVTVSIRKRRGLSMKRQCLLAALRTEEAARPEQQHERHRCEQHDIGVAWIDHRRDADDLSRNQAAKNGTRKRSDATDDDDDKRLYEDRLAHIGRQRHDGRIHNAREACGHRTDAEHDHKH